MAGELEKVGHPPQGSQHTKKRMHIDGPALQSQTHTHPLKDGAKMRQYQKSHVYMTAWLLKCNQKFVETVQSTNLPQRSKTVQTNIQGPFKPNVFAFHFCTFYFTFISYIDIFGQNAMLKLFQWINISFQVVGQSEESVR